MSTASTSSSANCVGRRLTRSDTGALPPFKRPKLTTLKRGQQLNLKLPSGATATVQVESHNDVLVLGLVAFKGGCSKTTMAIEIAHTFRMHYGWNVLLVD